MSDLLAAGTPWPLATAEAVIEVVLERELLLCFLGRREGIGEVVVAVGGGEMRSFLVALFL